MSNTPDNAPTTGPSKRRRRFLLIGLACGAVSGGITSVFSIQPFIATLAMMVFARGLAKTVSGGMKISTAVKNPDGTYRYADVPGIFNLIDSRVFGGEISVVTLIFLVCAGLCWALLARQVSPDMAITTDIIVGFPGESEVEFAESLQFVREMQFAGGHVFNYSARPGTAAERLPGQVPLAVRRQRSQAVRDGGSGEDRESHPYDRGRRLSFTPPSIADKLHSCNRVFLGGLRDAIFSRSDVGQ